MFLYAGLFGLICLLYWRNLFLTLTTRAKDAAWQHAFFASLPLAAKPALATSVIVMLVDGLIIVTGIIVERGVVIVNAYAFLLCATATVFVFFGVAVVKTALLYRDAHK